MVEGNISQDEDKCNASFVAIHWAKALRLETDTYVPASWVQLYPVIASFQINGCYLSHDKLAAYAGMRKADIKQTIYELIDKGHIKEDKYKGRKSYKINTKYDPDKPGEFYMIGTELIKHGVWGSLKQTRQVIYSILQAFTKHSAYVDPYSAFSDFENDYNFLKNMFINGEYSLDTCSYLKLNWYEPAKIISSAKNCRIDCSEKTLQRVKKDLQDMGLMFYVEEGGGYFFPRKPGLKVTGFDERLEKIEAAQKEHKISYAAKRAALASIKLNQGNKDNSKFVKI